MMALPAEATELVLKVVATLSGLTIFVISFYTTTLVDCGTSGVISIHQMWTTQLNITYIVMSHVRPCVVKNMKSMKLLMNDNFEE